MVDAIQKICAQDYQNLMSLPNVMGVGMGYKVANGMKTDSLCAAVFVTKKISQHRMLEQALVPKTYRGVPTDVVEMGNIQVQGLKDKITPIIQGYSIGLDEASGGLYSGGSAGCLVYDKYNVSSFYILTSSHLFLTGNEDPTGKPVCQPSKVDDPVNARIIGNVARYIPVFTSSPGNEPINYVDCAIVKLISNSLGSPLIYTTGKPTGIEAPTLGLIVGKSGCASGYTRGEIQYINTTYEMPWVNNKRAIFKDQILTTSMSQSGDSGAVLVNPRNKKIIGLLMGIGNYVTCYNPIDQVLQSLNIGLVV